MSANGRIRQWLTLGLLMAITHQMATLAPAPRDRRPRALTTAEAWARMTPLERGLAADREDPNFDYAAN
jgi:hypothetical protein